VYAAIHGYELAKDSAFSFIGFLDADIRVEKEYYQRLMGEFLLAPRLGLCGGAVVDKYDDRLVDIRKGSEDYHVAGGVQFFRRLCFEQIGGYHPIDGGGQDTIADVMSMMNGWEIRVIPQLVAIHLRPDGFAKEHVYRRGMKWGRKFYLIGYHPLYYMAQCLRRINQSPIFINSACQFFGFITATIKGEKRPVTDEFVVFLRTLQLKRLRDRFFTSDKSARR
jgi:hypothetical protein